MRGVRAVLTGTSGFAFRFFVGDYAGLPRHTLRPPLTQKGRSSQRLSPNRTLQRVNAFFFFSLLLHLIVCSDCRPTRDPSYPLHTK